MFTQRNQRHLIWLLSVLALGSLLLSACGPGGGRLTPRPTDQDGDPYPYPYPGPTDDDLTPEDEIEFIGVVNRIGPEVWLIGEHEVLVTPDTEIGRGVELGALVKVHAHRRAGTLVAREIELARDHDDTPEPTRTITRTPNHTPEVTRTATREATHTREPETSRTPEPSRTATREVTRTAEPTHERTPDATHTREPNHTPEPTRTGTREPDHTPEPTASATREPEHTPEPTRTAEPTHEPTHAPTHTPVAEVEFTGPLTAINGNVWTVGDHSVIVTGDTEIRGDPHVGDMVKVHGWPQPDGSVVAREIRKVQ